jgi:hypothetical protein
VPLSPQILVIAVSWQKHDIQAFANALIRTPLFFAHLLVPTTPNPFNNSRLPLFHNVAFIVTSTALARAAE